MLDAAGIGWVDETRQRQIAIGNIVVSRTGNDQRPVAPDPKWTPAVVAVSKALLLGTAATVAATSTATGLSAGSTTNALRTFTRLNLLYADAGRGRGSARHIRDHDELLDAYATSATALSPPERITVGVTWRDPVGGAREIGRRLNDLGVNWAATGTVAAAIIAPLITNVSGAAIYIDAFTIPTLCQPRPESG